MTNSSKIKPSKIKQVRASVIKGGEGGGGADYHDQGEGHWIDNHIATSMGRYPEYRQSRKSFGINVLGTLVVEIECEDGTTGFAVTTGGEPAAYMVEKHFARFLEGRDPFDYETIWDQMYFASQYYGRKGLVVNAISGVDLALWDLMGRLRGEPVYHMLGGAVRNELQFYATGARPDLAKQMGFIGGKLPLLHGPVEGDEGLKKNVPAGMLVTTGEHEATRWGFRMLMEMDCCDLIQPDVGWCGGVTELLKISAMADARGIMVVPHGSSVYSYHFVITRHNSPFAEFLMMAPKADHVAPMFHPQLLGEPVPVNGRLNVSALDKPGFGVELNPDVKLYRPYTH